MSSEDLRGAEALRPARRSTSTRAGLLTTAMTLLNVVVGLAFQSLLAAALGLGPLADDFQLAWTVVTFWTTGLFSLVPSLLVPRMATSSGRVGIMDAVPPIVLGGVFSAIQVALAISASGSIRDLLIWSAPSALVAGMTAWIQAVSYIDRRFILAAVGPVANGVGLCVTTLVSHDSLTAKSLGAALTVGYLCQLLLTAVPLVASRRPVGAAGAITWRVFFGAALFTVVAKFQPVLERALSSALVGEGSTAALGLAQKIAQGALLMATFGLALTATASLAERMRSREVEGAGALMGKVLVATVVLTVVVTCLSAPLAYVGTRILYQHGTFGSEDTARVAAVVLCQLPWIFANSVAGVLTTCLYVQGLYARVLLSSGVGLALTAIVSFALDAVGNGYAVPIGSSLGAVGSCITSFAILARTELGSSTFAELGELRAALRWSAATLVGVLAAYGALLIAESGRVIETTLPLVLLIGSMIAAFRRSAVRHQILRVFRAEV